MKAVQTGRLSSIMFEIFKNYRFHEEKLLAYGFEKDEVGYHLSKVIMSGDFQMQIQIKDQQLHFQVIDCDTDEEYIHVHLTSVTGEFVGQVREACLQVLEDIRAHCCTAQGFIYEQSQRLVEHIEEVYQGQIEYLWDKSSRKSTTHAGVFRHDVTKKWYGVFMTTDWSKLDAKRTGMIEVLNVKNDTVADLVQKEGIYPAFHMNKKYWLSLPLDDKLTDQELYQLLKISYRLTKKK